MPMNIDICNGDGDGLCAVLQWRLQEPLDTRLVTGLKRDIALLDRVEAGAGDKLLVCDLSLQRNLAPLMRLLQAGAQVRYFDHHKVDPIPWHPLLESHIDFRSDICTSLLVDRYLGGKLRAWALVGAFGDASCRSAPYVAVRASKSCAMRPASIRKPSKRTPCSMTPPAARTVRASSAT